MKPGPTSLLACAALSLSANGDFNGIHVELLDNADLVNFVVHDYDVYRVYAVFDDPSDAVVGVSGNPANPLVISTREEFYQDSRFGGDVEHLAAFEPFIPNLSGDSYLTIGSTDAANEPNTSTTNVAGNWSENELVITSGGWSRPPGDPFTFPQPIPGAGGELGVLIGQFTVTHNTDLDGSVILTAIIDDAERQFFTDFDNSGITCWQCTFCDGTMCEYVPCEEWVNPCDLELCDADTDASWVVDVDDLLNVILDWGTDGTANGGNVDDSNDVVDVDDLVLVIQQWGCSALP